MLLVTDFEFKILADVWDSCSGRMLHMNLEDAVLKTDNFMYIKGDGFKYKPVRANFFNIVQGIAYNSKAKELYWCGYVYQLRTPLYRVMFGFTGRLYVYTEGISALAEGGVLSDSGTGICIKGVRFDLPAFLRSML